MFETQPISRDNDAMYARLVKVRSSNGSFNEYVRVVEAYREGAKPKRQSC